MRLPQWEKGNAEDNGTSQVTNCDLVPLPAAEKLPLTAFSMLCAWGISDTPPLSPLPPPTNKFVRWQLFANLAQNILPHPSVLCILQFLVGNLSSEVYDAANALYGVLEQGGCIRIRRVVNPVCSYFNH